MLQKESTEMMRIAIAGGGGFADILAAYISQTAHALLILSTREHPELAEQYDCRVAVVNYGSVEDLSYALQGTDLVISTIRGVEQINLIDAARRARVRRFVPSEFEGSLSHRPTADQDPFDNGSAQALDWLRHWSSSRQHPMQYTVFSCGVFMERFAPGGLAAYNIGSSHQLYGQGDYMIDISNATAEIPETNAQGRPVNLTLTSVHDVAHGIASALDLGLSNWSREYKIRGSQLTTRRITEICSEVRNIPFQVTSRPYHELLSWSQYHEDQQELVQWYSVQHLIQTANGRYVIGEANLNERLDFRPLNFRQWLEANWGAAQ